MFWGLSVRRWVDFEVFDLLHPIGARTLLVAFSKALPQNLKNSSLLEWRPWLLGWRLSLLGWMPLLVESPPAKGSSRKRFSPGRGALGPMGR